ncbi:serine hydrolase domain-containing protein [Actinoplanes sp. NPDC051494]|uniref:serine hydrolase domain-containing protein n=1 Tax=Actinoplanes sp. NPDC051494 TaxID=3363907 RepID=UPI0037A51E1A
MTLLPDAVSGSSTAGERVVTAQGPTEDFRIASLTKMFTSAALVLTLRELGIPLHTPVADLLPGSPATPALTVERTLAQVSGLRESVGAAAVARLELADAARLVLEAGHDREPGTRWSYYNGNYFLAGAILATLTGLPYEEALRRRVLDPWGLTRTGWDGPAPSAYPRARRPSGGLWSCVPDLLTFAEHLLADKALLDETRTPRTRPDDPMTYALGWAIGPSGQMYLNGRLPGYRAVMLLVPDRDYASVVLTNRQDALPEVARTLSDMQFPLTGDDLTAAIDGFAA